MSNIQEDKKQKRVCIVGAGPSGLAALHFLSPYCCISPNINDDDNNDHNNDARCFVVECMEKQPAAGGLWNYDWRTGLDQYGEPQHGGMYQCLVSNGPKECLEMADYTFDEHCGGPIVSFPPRETLTDYILGRAKKHGLLDLIKYSTVVRNVQPCETGNGYWVESEHLPSREKANAFFDYVVIATGHFSTPNMPDEQDLPGIGSFPGRVLHAHDFRSAFEFSTKDVLVLGSSYSAEDIALQIVKFGGRSVTVSYRTKAMNFRWPVQIDERPMLTNIQGRLVTFQDGTSKEFDAIVFCTGYKHSFPFVDPRFRLETPNVLYPDKLYKGILMQDTDNLFYLGMQDQFYTFTMFDLQALTMVDIMLGRMQLPDFATRQQSIVAWRNRMVTLQTCTDQIHFQADYMRDELLAMKRGSLYQFDLDHTVQMLIDWEEHKCENILSYRDKCFISPKTGTSGLAPLIPWWVDRPSS